MRDIPAGLEPHVTAAISEFFARTYEGESEADVLTGIIADFILKLREENERLRNCLETITGIHGTNPSLPYADAPEADYLKHVLWEVRQLAREALKGDE